MNNTLSIEQLKELFKIQMAFDERIPTLNLTDSKIAYTVEFFEWFNTLETFKNWKKQPGKPLDVQLDELADMLAFGLSIAHQSNLNLTDLEPSLPNIESVNDYQSSYTMYGFMADVVSAGIDEENAVLLPLNIAYNLYTVDQLINAYKKKMERNHARQDGTADTDKGYT